MRATTSFHRDYRWRLLDQALDERYCDSSLRNFNCSATDEAGGWNMFLAESGPLSGSPRRSQHRIL
jgi:hypothetical protein